MDVMGESTLADRPQEWLAMPGGRLRQVVSLADGDGIAELLPYAAWLARIRPSCQCGSPRLGSGRTCGSAECIAGLTGQPSGAGR